MKNTHLILTAYLLLTTVTAQEINNQEGNTVMNLILSIRNNTQAQQVNSKRIEDLYGRIEEQNREWIGRNLLGTSVFMTFLYLFFVVIDKVRTNKGKKKREEYIRELEAELKATKEGLIETLKYSNDMNKEIIEDNIIIRSQIKNLLYSINSSLSRKDKIGYWIFGVVFGYLLAGVTILLGEL